MVLRKSVAFFLLSFATIEAFRSCNDPSSFFGSSRISFVSIVSKLHTSSTDENISEAASYHTVNGVICREVTNELPVIGTVKVLEATADSQEELVDECLHLHEDDDGDEDIVNNKNLPAKRIAQGDPYGAVLWPAAWAVSNYLLSESDLRESLSSTVVLELGTGTGLVSISAALGGAKSILATDYEPLALELTRYASLILNQDKKRIDNIIDTRLLDLCAFHQDPLPIDSLKESNEGCEVLVVAADIMYEPKTGTAMAYRAVEALKQNCRVIVGDSPGRPGRPAFLQTLWELGVDKSVTFKETIGKTCSGPRHDLICGEGSTSVSPTPEELSVALLDLKPSMLQKR